jgi:hypothetical protein
MFLFNNNLLIYSIIIFLSFNLFFIYFQNDFVNQQKKWGVGHDKTLYPFLLLSLILSTFSYFFLSIILDKSI